MEAVSLGLVTVKPGRSGVGDRRRGVHRAGGADPHPLPAPPGIPWTGGFGEVTVEDVKFVRADRQSREQVPYRGDWAKLDRVEASPHAGVIVLKEPFIPLWSSTCPRAPR